MNTDRSYHRGQAWAARGFTLLEMMVVIAIIGILVAVGLPAFKGFGQQNQLSAANRQLLDDLGLARLFAIRDRTDVYMVFVPPTNVFAAFAGETDPRTLKRLTNLISGQFTGYALMSRRTVGDQPGNETSRYLTEWKNLPEGMVFPPYQFHRTGATGSDVDPRWQTQPEYGRPLPLARFPFPTSRGREMELPWIGFNAEGQLISQQDLVLSFARGSVLYPQGPDGRYLAEAPDLVLTPSKPDSRYYVRINWLTGRAESEIPGFKDSSKPL